MGLRQRECDLIGNGSRRGQGGFNDDSSSNRTRILDWRKCWPSSGDTHLGKAGNVMSNENDRLVADFAC